MLELSPFWILSWHELIARRKPRLFDRGVISSSQKALSIFNSERTSNKRWCDQLAHRDFTLDEKKKSRLKDFEKSIILIKLRLLEFEEWRAGGEKWQAKNWSLLACHLSYYHSKFARSFGVGNTLRVMISNLNFIFAIAAFWLMSIRSF